MIAEGKLTLVHKWTLALVACGLLSACSGGVREVCLGASDAVSESDSISPRSRCVLDHSEELSDQLLGYLKRTARFEVTTSGSVVISASHLHRSWIITELGVEAAVNTTGIPPQKGYVFWRGYKEPLTQQVIDLDHIHWPVGTLVRVETSGVTSIPSDLWRVAKISGRGVYIGTKSRFLRWFDNMMNVQ